MLADVRPGEESYHYSSDRILNVRKSRIDVSDNYSNWRKIIRSIKTFLVAGFIPLDSVNTKEKYSCALDLWFSFICKPWYLY